MRGHFHTELSFHDCEPQVRASEGVQWIKVQESGTAVVIYLTPAQCESLGRQLLDIAEKAQAERQAEDALDQRARENYVEEEAEL